MSHDLLPLFVNGTLSPKDAREFEAHLASCADCRKEREMLERLRQSVERHGEDYFVDHPAAEEIVAAAMDELTATRRRQVQRHLAVCPTCAAEVRLVSGESDPAPVEAPRTRLGWTHAAVAFAAGVLIAAFVMPFLREPVAPGGALPSYRISAPRRDAGLQTITLPEGTRLFQVYFHVDIDRSLLPLEVEVRDPSGRVEVASTRASALSQEGFLFVLIDRAALDGDDHVVSVRSSVDPNTQLQYGFRILKR